LSETRTWTAKSFHRNLISDAQHQEMMDKIIHLNKKLNNYINWLEEQMKKQKDDPNPQSPIPNPQSLIPNPQSLIPNP